MSMIARVRCSLLDPTGLFNYVPAWLETQASDTCLSHPTLLLKQISGDDTIHIFLFLITQIV